MRGTPYQLLCQPLTLEGIVTTVDRSVREARSRPEQEQRRAFMAGIGYLLAGDVRSLGHHWAPADDAHYDDWVRWGAYNGARSAWTGSIVAGVVLPPLTMIMVQSAVVAAQFTVKQAKAETQ